MDFPTVQQLDRGPFDSLCSCEMWLIVACCGDVSGVRRASACSTAFVRTWQRLWRCLADTLVLVFALARCAFATVGIKKMILILHIYFICENVIGVRQSTAGGSTVATQQASFRFDPWCLLFLCGSTTCCVCVGSVLETLASSYGTKTC